MAGKKEQDEMRRMKAQTSDKPPMRELSEIFKDEEIVRCNCGSAAFFDWGITLLGTVREGAERTERYKGMALDEKVRVCMSCQKPVVLYGGDLFDASEFIDKKQIAELISREKASHVPGHTMDP